MFRCAVCCHGITPAYAGKSDFRTVGLLLHRDHPRVCGEKFLAPSSTVFLTGSPPRMRGKVRPMSFDMVRFQDHPRVCGEKPNRILWEHWKEGSPPRMRGKGCVEVRCGLSVGITPAYAGKSSDVEKVSHHPRDHPRVCGEKSARCMRFETHSGSPPRMRGKDGTKEWADKMGRITPAYAGKSLVSLGSLSQVWDHPRVCGEKSEFGKPALTG